MNGVSVYTKEAPEGSLDLSTTLGHSKKALAMNKEGLHKKVTMLNSSPWTSLPPQL